MNNSKHTAAPLSASALSVQPPPARRSTEGRNVARFHPGVRLEPGRDYADPTTYTHPWPSMADFARHLALGQHAPRTRHSYYHDMRLLHQHFGCDPAALTEAQVADYLIHVKMVKHWRPKTVRQTAASARLFFVLFDFYFAACGSSKVNALSSVLPAWVKPVISMPEL